MHAPLLDVVYDPSTSPLNSSIVSFAAARSARYFYRVNFYLARWFLFPPFIILLARRLYLRTHICNFFHRLMIFIHWQICKDTIALLHLSPPSFPLTSRNSFFLPVCSFPIIELAASFLPFLCNIGGLWPPTPPQSPTSLTSRVGTPLLPFYSPHNIQWF